MTYREGVGIIIQNSEGRLFFAERSDAEGAWQFPQGGTDGEAPELAAWRELVEETGLKQDQVDLVKESEEWTEYDLPAEMAKNWKGQKQKWFLFKLRKDQEIDLSLAEDKEFSQYKWVTANDAIHQTAGFRKDCYRKALQMLGL